MNSKVSYLFCILCLSTFIANAQLKVYSTGRVDAGKAMTYFDPLNVTQLAVLGPNGENRAGAKLALGDFGQYPNQGWNVFIGEYGTGDSDQLWLHGKLGTYITSNGHASNVVAYYNPSLNANFVFNTNLRVNGVNIVSDEKLKENVTDLTSPLKVLSKIKGVSYSYKSSALKDLSQPEGTSSSPLVSEGAMSEKERESLAHLKEIERKQAEKNSKRRIGFIAQDIQQVLPELVDEEEGVLSIDYIGMIPLLVEGLKELNAIIEEQNTKIALLEELLDEKDAIQFRSSPLNNEEVSGLNGAKLYQNYPNPFNIETKITYQLPHNYRSAYLYIYSLSGSQVKKYDLTNYPNQISISAGELNPGMYIYTLVVDDSKISSKRMIVTK